MQFLVHRLIAITFLTAALPAARAYRGGLEKLRTVVTTDMEQDDLSSLIRFLLYTNDLDAEGIIYSSSEYHWAGDGNHTTYDWTGTRTIQDKVLTAYAQVYSNLLCHDPSYPEPDELLAKVKIGNIAYEGEMDHDTDGSNLIRTLLLNEDPRPLYLQAWGGTNTIARALKSIEEQYSGLQDWNRTKDTVSHKAVIMASGFQDATYTDYIALNWPEVRVEQLSAGYATWGYNCNEGQGNVRGLPDAHVYFTGDWIKANIETGPYGKLYRSWKDGQSMPGNAMDIWGNPNTTGTSWCRPLGPYDFLSEGDNVAYNPLLTTGIQNPSNPNLGSWGGRAAQNTTSPDLWVMVDIEKNQNGAEIEYYTTNRWAEAAQNDFAARMHWTLMPEYRDGNHAPSVEILNGKMVEARPGSTVTLTSKVSDPDHDEVTTSWWQYFEEGTYQGSVTVTKSGNNQATVSIPADAWPGQTISIIVQATDDGRFPLTRYDRVFILVL